MGREQEQKLVNTAEYGYTTKNVQTQTIKDTENENMQTTDGNTTQNGNKFASQPPGYPGKDGQLTESSPNF